MIVASTNWRSWRKELVVPSKNSYVYKLGFRHAIYWYGSNPAAEKKLSKVLGGPNHQWHYIASNGSAKLRTGIVSYPEKRWYYGPHRWGDQSKHTAHWAVFKTDKDRTLAMLCL